MYNTFQPQYQDDSFHHGGYDRGGEGGYRGGGGGGRGRGGHQGGFQPRRNTDMDKPWVTRDIRQEIWKQIQLSKAAKKSRSGEDFEALSAQKERVTHMLDEAREIWFLNHPDKEQHWLQVLAEENWSKSAWCDVCEKGFQSPSQLKEHESEHATCGIDGCGYTAHQDILEKHIMHQHLSGLYNRIPQGNSPEEIAKWKAERRKNFPTREKVEAKEAERQEQISRGEVMRHKPARTQATNQQSDTKQQEEQQQQGPDWECNCKARFMLDGGGGRGQRGRGGRRGRGRNFVNYKNLKHQHYCKELENIRERARVKRESRASERITKLKENKEKRESGSSTKTEWKRDNATEVEEAESCSEDEEWNGGLFMFPGTGGWRRAELLNSDSSAPDVANTAVSHFQISDDESDLPASNQGFHISDDEDDLPPVAAVVNAKPVVESILTTTPVPEECLTKADVPTDMPDNVRFADHDDDDDDGPPEEVSVAKTDHFQQILDDKEKEEELNNGKKEETEDTDKAKSSRKRKRNRSGPAAKGIDETMAAKRAPPKDVFTKPIRGTTLLERLLLDEIRRERNVVLQCVRYVCNKNFLQDSDSLQPVSTKHDPKPPIGSQDLNSLKPISHQDSDFSKPISLQDSDSVKPSSLQDSDSFQPIQDS